jgi:hypothetical protein
VGISTTEKNQFTFSLIGAFAFALVSLAVFATVAFAESWMYRTLGLYGAYLVWTVLFILLGGGALHSLVKETMRPLKFYSLFSVAFLLYAIGWVAVYFILRDGVGEWVASLVGSVLMALVFAAGFGILPLTLKFSAILFIANSAGYFLGLLLNDSIKGKIGMLLWGVAYGLFLGAGLGNVFHLAQRTSQSHSKI